MGIPPAFLDELRARTALAALVGRRVKLVRAGREWKGCCPFHQEKTPSFYVNEDKGFYHCFGCGAHGDAVRFLMELDGETFPDAVRKLAAEAGLEVPRPSRPAPEEEGQARLMRILGAAADWFRQQLAGSDGVAARAYLAGRGLDSAEVAAFGLGLAPDRRGALAAALAERLGRVDPADLLAAGLEGGADGRRYERFRGRLLFPIHDGRGRMAGFGGRALDGREPKYLNSAEGPLFAKGRLLYNLHRAAPAARRAGRLVIAEGYMDVIGLASAGVAEAVASLGTALTPEQLDIAWRLAPEPILAFDGDAAGRRAAVRAALRALPHLAAGRSIQILSLPPGEDPDDVARRGGAEAVAAMLAGAVPLERFLFDTEAAAAPLDTPERRAGLRARLNALAGEIADEGLRRDYRQSWERRWRAMTDGLFARPSGGRRGAHGSGRATPAAGALPETRATAGLRSELGIAMLLRRLADEPELADAHVEALVALPLASPALASARDRLAAGQPATALLEGYRPLTIDPAQIGQALASLIEEHHMARGGRDAGPESADAEAVFARHRRQALGHQARLRLLAGLVDEDDRA